MKKHNLLILTDMPTHEHEKLCFNTLRLYSEVNKYDLMYLYDYVYDDTYDYLFYISNNCLILDINIKIENYINDNYFIMTYSKLLIENIKDFLIIKNNVNILNFLNDINNVKRYKYHVSKRINYLSFFNNDKSIVNYKSERFFEKTNNPFFFIYGDYEKNNKNVVLNNVFLGYLYNQLFNIKYNKKNYIDININFNDYEYDKELEIFNPGNEIAFVTSYTPNIKDIGIQMEYNIKKYCEKNNYTLYIHRGLTFDVKNNQNEKFILLDKYLNKHEYVIWIDSDVLCFDMEFKIELLIKNKISCYLYRNFKEKINTGFILFKNDEVGRQIINDFIKINKYSINSEIINVINNNYLENSYINNNMEIGTPVSILNKKTKFIKMVDLEGFPVLLLMEYLNYVIFNIKYKI